MNNQFINQYKTKQGKLMLIWVSLSLLITISSEFYFNNQTLEVIEGMISVLCFFIILKKTSDRQNRQHDKQ